MGAGLPLDLPELTEGYPDVALIPILSDARGVAIVLKKWARKGRLPDAIAIEHPMYAGGHFIDGPPGEDETHSHASLDRVLAVGVDGLKLHPLHVAKHTKLAIEWKRGEYAPLTEADYVRIAADLVERTPWEAVFRRVAGTAACDILLTPAWCAKKRDVLNGITQELERRGTRQGTRAGQIWKEQTCRLT
jgi:radical SAM superfamily enzyme